MVQRWRWWILAVWVIACGALFALVPEADPTANERTNFLPPTTPFRQAMDLQGRGFPTRGGLSQAVLVIERPGGKLSTGPDGDRAFIEKLARELRLPREGGLTPQEAGSMSVRSPGLLDAAFEAAFRLDALRWLLEPKIPRPGQKPLPPKLSLPPNPMRSPVTEAGQASVIRVNIPVDYITLHSTKIVGQIRDLVASVSSEAGLPTRQGPLRKPPGLRIAVTGTGGYGHDYAEFVRQSHTRTMQATLIAVIVILLIVYRAPLAAIVPLAAISLAAAIILKLMNIAQGMGVSIGLAEQIFVFVLMFGAGIDYSLLLISRTREFLVQGLDPAQAVTQAVNATSPAIVASAATDAVGLLTLVFCAFLIFKTTGPVVAAAFVVAMLTAITLVPALLAILGKRIFWPRGETLRLPTMQSDGQDARGTKKLWPAVAGWVTARPGLVLVATLAVLAVPAIRASMGIDWSYDALAGIDAQYLDRNGEDVSETAPEGVGNAAAGIRIAERHLPVGETAPVTVLLEQTSGLDGCGRSNGGRFPNTSLAA